MSGVRGGGARTAVLVAALAFRTFASARRTLFLFLILGVPAGVALVERLFNGDPGADVFRSYASNLYLVFLVQMVTLFHGASLFADEIDDGTLSYFLTRPIPKSTLLLGKYAALVVFDLLLVLGSAAAAFAVDRECGGLRPLFTDGGPAIFLRFAATSVLAILAYGAVFTWCGIAFRRPVVIGIVYILVVEVFLGSLAGPPRKITLSCYLEALLAPGGFTTRASLAFAAGPDAGRYWIASPGLSVAVLVAVTILGLSACVLTLRRRDYVLRGGAEG